MFSFLCKGRQLLWLLHRQNTFQNETYSQTKEFAHEGLRMNEEQENCRVLSAEIVPIHKETTCNCFFVNKSLQRNDYKVCWTLNNLSHGELHFYSIFSQSFSYISAIKSDIHIKQRGVSFVITQIAYFIFFSIVFCPFWAQDNKY